MWQCLAVECKERWDAAARPLCEKDTWSTYPLFAIVTTIEPILCPISCRKSRIWSLEAYHRSDMVRRCRCRPEYLILRVLERGITGVGL
jgi:hypothetical protein